MAHISRSGNRYSAVQAKSGSDIALFSFELDGDDIKVSAEHHYRLVAADAVTDDDLERYRQRLRDTGWRT